MRVAKERRQYREMILPETVIRRLDAILEPLKQAVTKMSARPKQQILRSDFCREWLRIQGIKHGTVLQLK